MADGLEEVYQWIYDQLMKRRNERVGCWLSSVPDKNFAVAGRRKAKAYILMGQAGVLAGERDNLRYGGGNLCK